MKQREELAPEKVLDTSTLPAAEEIGDIILGDDYIDLSSCSATDLLQGDTITNVNIEKISVNEKAYLIDLSDENITVMSSWMRALKSFIGNVTDDRYKVALYLKTLTGIFRLGYTDEYMARKLLKPFIEASISSGEARLFRTTLDTRKWLLVTDDDIAGLRLSIV